MTAILRIKKRLGGLETKTAINFLIEDDVVSSFSVLLTYYDKLYLKGANNRENPELLILDEPCQGLDGVQTDRLKTVLDYLAAQSEMTLLYVSHYDRDIPSCVNQTLTLKRL